MNMGERFEEAMAALPAAPDRRLPVVPEIRRENGSVTITNTYHVVVNYGREEDNKRDYPDACGCKRGCAPADAIAEIRKGHATPQSTGEKLFVAGCLSAAGYALFKVFHHFL